MQPSPLQAPMSVLQGDLRLQVERYRFRKLQEYPRCIACGGILDIGAKLSPDGDGPLCPGCEVYVYQKRGHPKGGQR